jgi:hypothetical protein
MANEFTSEELQQLVSKAVAKALAQRKLSQEEIHQILRGPITIGIIARPPIQELPRQAALVSETVDKHRLIGFVAPNFEQLKSELEKQ